MRADADEGAALDSNAEQDESQDERTQDERLKGALEDVINEGMVRLERDTSSLLATGFVGGLDVTIGVFGLLLVLDHEGNTLLASLVFSIGFVAITVGKSELFTENFLVPIAAVVAEQRGLPSLLRLWAGTAVTNLVGGWVLALLIVTGFPEVGDTAVDLGQHFVEMGIGWQSLTVGMLAGVIITLMTWMIEGTRSVGAQILASIVAGFLLAAGEMNHVIVASVEMFAGLIAGAPYGYVDWLSVFVWAAFANMLGGIGLVTVLRLVQAGEGIRPVRQRIRP